MAFYKKDNGMVLEAPNFVLNKDYELKKETKDTHIYPIDGWYWFDTIEEAYTFLGIEFPKEEIK